MELLINITDKSSSEVRMEFGVDKVNKGTKVEFDGMSLPNDDQMHHLEDEGYKYLGILEASNILHTEMKTLVSKEFVRRARKILKSQLHGRNCIQGINTMNTCGVPVIRYGARILSWRTKEIKSSDFMTQKLMRIHGAHHPQGNVDRLYDSRQLGGTIKALKK